jgi:CheY-like chemotaxis protein
VLIADNDPGVTGVLTLFLERAGLRVEAVADGEEALTRLRGGGVDLLVCDLDMPRLSGEDVLAELAGWAAAPPVLVVSGYVDSRLEGELSGHPAVRAVLRKPFDLVEFSRRVVDLVGGASGPGEEAAS